ncbi:hypothetical protein [Caulobacter mirabilis]|uniref:T6SS immunity protein Tdi1 C-terminal domain-containing protein n=1 Tax=Caulobacter mirabilis TaxID=69666 RepID=A0A2D2AUU6_9CAUL|nr:hypothetical protein [Caulobacter mirabilis]ATQ41733.1 hypothetical protein CSW64_04575 [Caulobacter mirabilis]
MSVRWADLIFQPDAALSKTAIEAWSWKIAGLWRPVLMTRMADVFFERDDGVHWLECATGEVSRVADSESRLHALMQGDDGELWHMRPVVEALHEAGKKAGEGQCYWFITPPGFEGGVYTPENMFVAPAHEVVSLSADLHRQICDLPDGAAIKLRVV